MFIKYRFCIFTLILALTCTAVEAGVLGKINGFVRDATGSPLPGANVVLEGTQRGATTDPDGFYVILSLEPGTYSLAASMVGYAKMTQSDVQVRSDYTTQVNFQLTETEIQAEEMLVIAERPPVEPDKTTSKYTVSSVEIERLPIVRTTDELVALQPGVSQDGAYRVRGGDAALGNQGSNYRPTDVAFVVDGVRILHQDGQGARMFTGINKSAIQEISVITGVTPAEYGNSQAGVINVVTKEGGQAHHGWLEYRNTPPGKKHWGANVYDAPIHRGAVKWGDSAWEQETDPEAERRIHERTDYTGVMGHGLEASVSGPLTRHISFMLSGKHDREASVFPGPENVGFRAGNRFIHAPDNIQGSSSVTWRMTPHVKLKAGLVLQTYSAWEPNEGQASVRGIGQNYQNLFLPADWSASGQFRFREDLEYLVLTHIVSPRTFYEVRLSRGRSLQDTSSVPTQVGAVRRDANRKFYLGTERPHYQLFDRQRYTLKADLSSQVTKGHFFKAGTEWVLYNAWWTWRRDTYRNVNNTYVFFYGGDRQIAEPVNPIQGAFYVQDKMEFEGMVINAGLRFDYFNLRDKWPVNTTFFSRSDTQYFTTRDLTPTVDVASTFNISPRLGISHPISDRAAMHFSSGLFIQYPELFAYYGNAYFSNKKQASLDLNKDSQIGPQEEWNNMIAAYGGTFTGNAHIKPEKSLQFEVGGDWNFVSDYTASLTTYYRSEWDQLGAPHSSFRDPKGGVQAQTPRENNRVEEARGFELAVRKRFSYGFSFQVAYNMQWTSNTHFVGKGNAIKRIAVDSLYVANGNWTLLTVDPVTGARIPKQMTQQDIERYGARANNQFRNFNGRVERGDTNGSGFRQGEYDLAIPYEEEPGVYLFGASQLRGIHEWGLKPGDVRNSGKIQMVFTTPWDLDMGAPWVNVLLRNFNINVLYRIQNGQTFKYQPPTGGQPEFRTRPIESRFDLQAMKSIHLTDRVQAQVFLSVFNLFNEKNLGRIDNTVDWVEWGLAMPRPDNSVFNAHGDINDRRRYTARSRQTELGLRIMF